MYVDVYVCYSDWRRRSGEVDVPHDLFNGMELEGVLNLDEIQLRTSFPETWLFEQGKTIYRKTEYAFIYNIYAN